MSSSNIEDVNRSYPDWPNESNEFDLDDLPPEAKTAVKKIVDQALLGKVYLVRANTIIEHIFHLEIFISALDNTGRELLTPLLDRSDQHLPAQDFNRHPSMYLFQVLLTGHWQMLLEAIGDEEVVNGVRIMEVAGLDLQDLGVAFTMPLINVLSDEGGAVVKLSDLDTLRLKKINSLTNLVADYKDAHASLQMVEDLAPQSSHEAAQRLRDNIRSMLGATGGVKTTPYFKK